jgi:hypothetical protein
MANPRKDVALVADKSGDPVLSDRQANVADHATPAAYSAHASGAVAVVSNAATDLDTTAAALEALRDEAATIVLKMNAILDVLEEHGLMTAS